MRLDSITNLYFQTSSWLTEQIPLPQSSQLQSSDFDWDKIIPSETLRWHDCFGDFQCARLQVPMDWTGTSLQANQTVELAVVKVDATVPVTDPSYGGAVILNPGGPGGSGVGQILRGGHNVRTVLSAGPDADKDSAKHFTILGFDPRGVNNTRPVLACFPTGLEAAVNKIEEAAYGSLGSSNTSFDNLWASKRATAESCSKRYSEQGIAKHVDTAPVARDIIEIAERFGQWREQQSLLELSGLQTLSKEERDAIVERTRYKPNEEMVQYWGFSYGTILGATLSTMYPNRINRAVLDGVADAPDYMAGGWTTNLQDTDLLFIRLAEYCFEGGSDNCPLYDEDGPAAIIERIAKTLETFRSNPIAVPDLRSEGKVGPQIATYHDLQSLIREIVYNPLREFPLTTRVLAELEKGNGTSLAHWKADKRPKMDAHLSFRCEQDGFYSPSCYDPGAWLLDATSGIACSDGLDKTHWTKEGYREYSAKISAQSRLIGESWAEIQLPCTAWHARPHWRYEGNFHNQTAHPILFVGNTIDPVTPLRNAFTMAKGFEGAGILHQNSEGHCTYAAPSMCSGRALRDYFQTGRLPGKPNGFATSEYEDAKAWKGHAALCEPDVLPLTGYDRDAIPDLPKGETDRALWDALVGLNQKWYA